MLKYLQWVIVSNTGCHNEEPASVACANLTVQNTVNSFSSCLHWDLWLVTCCRSWTHISGCWILVAREYWITWVTAELCLVLGFSDVFLMLPHDDILWEDFVINSSLFVVHITGNWFNSLGPWISFLVLLAELYGTF